MRSFRIGAELTLVGDGTSVSVTTKGNKTLTDTHRVSKHSSFKHLEQSKLFSVADAFHV